VSAWIPRVLLGLAVVGVIAAIYSISVGSGGPQPQLIGGVNDVQRIFGGIEQEDAFIGPNDAETTITVFNDIQCTPCADWEVNTVDPLVEEYARTGDARLEFRHFSLAPNDTTLAAIAAEAAGKQARQWQYLDTFVRNIDVARSKSVDEQFLREVAEAVPELETDQWLDDYRDPATEQLVRDDAMLAAQLKLPAEPAVIVSGPAGERQLIETPSQTAIEQAVDQVSGGGSG
jgi:protein-disulfide isomerase